MLHVKKLVKGLAFATVMFGAGATVATVALSYLPSVFATPGVVAGGVKQSKAEQVVEDNGLKWELQNCRRAGQNVVCNFLLTNIGQSDTFLWFDGYECRIFDLSGNEYKAIAGGIGGQKSSPNTTLIRGIPTKANVTFAVPQEVMKLAVLEVRVRNHHGILFSNVQFRDVNVSGSQAPNPANPGTKCICPPQTNPKKPRPR